MASPQALLLDGSWLVHVIFIFPSLILSLLCILSKITNLSPKGKSGHTVYGPGLVLGWSTSPP